VYQARDTRLDRHVALKVLAPELATDPEFRARFAHEAKTISALNHPHICGLFDIGHAEGIDYLVLELLEGETLAARLERGPLPLTQVLRMGIEIADALEAAHQKGIIHRDLKPGNVMLTGGGTKLLDFGLAKHTTGPAGEALSMLATAPGTGTAQGTLIGTLQYMAPEQVQGQPADTRTDIFAFGTIMHEMITGRRLFEASTQASLIAKILTSDVPATSTLARPVPPALEHVLHGCLAKEPAERWQSAHDVKLQLQWIQAQGARTELVTATALPPRRSRWVPWLMTALTSAALVGVALRPSVVRSPLPVVPAQFEMSLPEDMRVESGYDRAEISPDGRRLVFSASLRGRPQLFVRDLGSTTVTGLDYTDSAFFPFWSPDSRSIAFFANGKLMRMPVEGGSARVVADAPGWYRALTGGGTWTNGTILFSLGDGSIVRVPDTGGTPARVATLPWKAGQGAFMWPRFLPDGRHFLVSRAGDPALYVASLDSVGLRRVLEDASGAVYAAGQLLFLRGTSLFVRSFDPARLTFAGPERVLIPRTAFFSASDNGTVVYRPERTVMSRLTWFDRRGGRTDALAESGPYTQVVLSPRGHRATLVRRDTRTSGQALVNTDLWDLDLTSGILSRLTSDPARESDPSWSPDERRVAYSSRRLGPTGVFVKDVNSGADEPLVLWKEPVVVDQWTPDGQFVIFRYAGRAVWAMPLDDNATPRKLFETSYMVDEVHVSPDGRWVAYNADESGRWEVYVATFPAFTARRQVSASGGVQPQWSTDGTELFYLSGDGWLMAVRISPGPEFVSSPPARVFAARIQPTPSQPRYAVSRDGQRFLALETVEGEPNTLIFLVNAFDTQPPSPPTR